MLGRAVDDEPGVDRDAVSAHARSWLEDVDARVAVGEADHLPHVQPHLVGDDRQLVGKGDVDVAIGVLDQLGHLGRAAVGDDAFAAHEQLVEAERLAGAARRDPADRAVVVGQFLQDPAGQHPLGAVGDREVGNVGGQARALEVRAACRDQVAQCLGRADRRGRFEDHRVAALEHLGDGFAGSEDIGDVRGVVGIEGRRDGNDEDIGGGDFGRSLEQAARDDALDQAVEIDLLDMDFAAVDRIDDRLRHVDAVDLTPGARHDGGGRKPDISQADYTDVRLIVRFHSRSTPRYGAPTARPQRDCGPAPWPRRPPYRRAR